MPRRASRAARLGGSLPVRDHRSRDIAAAADGGNRRAGDHYLDQSRAANDPLPHARHFPPRQRALRLWPQPRPHHARDRPRRRHADHSRRQCLSIAGGGRACRLSGACAALPDRVDARRRARRHDGGGRRRAGCRDGRPRPHPQSRRGGTSHQGDDRSELQGHAQVAGRCAALTGQGGAGQGSAEEVREIVMSTSIEGAKAPDRESQADTSDAARRFHPSRVDFTNFKPRHFVWKLEGKVATVTLNRPERKNPLTLESYGELRDTFHDLLYAEAIKSVVITGAGGNFCSGGDVHEIIGPLVEMQRHGDTAGLLAFTRMTGDLVKSMRACPQPIVAAVDGICAGAGAILAMASDLRYGTARSKVAFLFVRVGLAGADMGACNMLPRIIGAGRASELLYTGRAFDGAEAERWGFYNKLCEPDAVLAEALALAKSLADGPTFAHAMTKRCIHQEWSMGIDESIEAEAQAQAICMQTKDYERAYEAFVRKEKPDFQGN